MTAEAAVLAMLRSNLTRRRYRAAQRRRRTLACSDAWPLACHLPSALAPPAALVALSTASFAQASKDPSASGGATPSAAGKSKLCDAMTGAEKEKCLKEEKAKDASGGATGSGASTPSTKAPSTPAPGGSGSGTSGGASGSGSSTTK